MEAGASGNCPRIAWLPMTTISSSAAISPPPRELPARGGCSQARSTGRLIDGPLPPDSGGHTLGMKATTSRALLKRSTSYFSVASWWPARAWARSSSEDLLARRATSASLEYSRSTKGERRSCCRASIEARTTRSATISERMECISLSYTSESSSTTPLGSCFAFQVSHAIL